MRYGIVVAGGACTVPTGRSKGPREARGAACSGDTRGRQSVQAMGRKPRELAARLESPPSVSFPSLNLSLPSAFAREVFLASLTLGRMDGPADADPVC